jgi:hypothetical protein
VRVFSSRKEQQQQQQQQNLSVRARVVYTARSVFVFFVFFVFTRERKGKEYNAETSVPFFPTRKKENKT